MSISKSVLTILTFESTLKLFFETKRVGEQFSLLQVTLCYGVKRLLGFLESGVYHTLWNGYPFKETYNVHLLTNEQAFMGPSLCFSVD